MIWFAFFLDILPLQTDIMLTHEFPIREILFLETDFVSVTFLLTDLRVLFKKKEMKLSKFSSHPNYFLKGVMFCFQGT